MSRPRILIAGGGIGGLTAAAALAQAGFPVELLEAAPEFGEIGAGVTLSPNAMRGFDFIGCMEEVAAAGVEPKRQRIQHWQDGRANVPMPEPNTARPMSISTAPTCTRSWSRPRARPA
jgi:salicylate hydroxylase